jgi:outer membrane biosynthesis protein TonB
MDAETAQDQQALVTQLAEAREKLVSLESDLRAVDDELAGLATEREQHRLLSDVCGSLEQLGKTGGAELFWGNGTTAGAGAEHLRRVRSRVDVFQGRLGEVEGRRSAILHEIQLHEGRAYLLEDDVFEAQEEEERRRQEWIVEREIGALATRETLMPWARNGEDDRRFRKTLATALLVCVLFALLLPFIDLPLNVLEKTVEVPERVVRMMMERPKPPPAPRAELAARPEERVVEQKPVEQPVPKPSTRPDKVEPKLEPEAVVPEKGILAFREKLAGLKEAKTDRLGLQARLSNSNDNASGRPERSMLTTNGPGSSGGINLSSLSRGLGGKGDGGSGGMAGVQVTRAASVIGGGNGGGASDRPLASGASASRTDEEIQIVFDRYKAALYRLYNRELRKDPSLRGQMVLRLTIEPAGNVSMCVLQSSDMNAPDLATQVVDRVRTINFGAKDVAAITIVYPIDFLPAA